MNHKIVILEWTYSIYLYASALVDGGLGPDVKPKSESPTREVPSSTQQTISQRSVTIPRSPAPTEVDNQRKQEPGKRASFVITKTDDAKIDNSRYYRITNITCNSQVCVFSYHYFITIKYSFGKKN